MTFARIGCGAFQLGQIGDSLYHDAGSDTLWSNPDGDGWGNL